MRVLAVTLALVASTAAAQGVAAPEPLGAGTVPAAPAQPVPADPIVRKPAAPAPVVPTAALLEKLGQGDRLSLAGDHRSALFVYQDAVYLQPRYPPARVRLGRAYLALRYPAQAIAQAEAALAEDPESAEARRLLEDAKAAAGKASGAAAGVPSGGAAPGTADAAPAKPGPRVFKLTPEPEPGPAGGAAVGGAAPVIVAVPVRPEAVEPAGPAAASAATPAQAEAAAQHYRTALGHMQHRDFAKAVAELSDAILADPKLAVAYSARGSAQFGLGKYREAAEDYRSAILLDASLGTPVYGLAECYRVLGDGKKAAEMYDRYARSTASDVREDLRATAAKRAEELR